ncbi:patatin-like phospholipase family protein [Glycomyces harbinensis]|uniref:Patatin-like phospholipase n=1 Tax=Glycomyces harbinensis TaxID=58114 RepID=A0A1G6RQF6_9ACTN|nr:patatin-like phospholipase family protein [Glycomyces harbinensis]SDD06872.1 Patatin-like phospholipase [Glycomyces harbinensis]
MPVRDLYDPNADAYWNDDHPVLELIRARRTAGTGPGEHGDGLRLGLAVEGGGMRGVISAAMLTALDDAGMRPVFDAVYSCSSGAVNASYFTAGETWYPLTIYFDDLSTKRFVDMRRFLTGRPVLNLEYVFEEVLARVKPLDYEAVLKNPVSFQVAVTLVDELETLSATGFTSADDLKEALRASCWLPMAVPGTGTFRGARAVDGGVLTAHPYLLALQDGCTHVLSLSTKPLRRPPSRPSQGRRISATYMERLRPGLGKGYIASLDRYRGQRRWLQERMVDPGEGPHVLDLAPLPWMREVDRQELALDKIMTGARQAHAVMAAAIEGVPAADLRDGRFASLPRFVTVRESRTERQD